MIRVGVSACLLGERVRHDGRHKRHDFLVDTLGAYVAYVAVCPEVELGLGTPRPPIEIAARGESERLIMPASGRDLTDEMTAFARRRVAALEGLSGYVLKGGSPSCGLGDAAVRRDGDQVTRDGVGSFARALRRRFPDLPIEDERGLDDAQRRARFVTRVFASARQTVPEALLRAIRA